MLVVRSDSPVIDEAFGIAVRDIEGNIKPREGGLLKEERPVFIAGAGYEVPWTRDAAINIWNGAPLVYPEESRNSMLSVIEEGEGGVRIGADYDQYWDAIIWSLGAWAFYLYTGDRDFLALALEATKNSLRDSEETEFTPSLGLFRGPAVYGDGVAAYPDLYARTEGGSSNILHWPAANPEAASWPGRGLPMHALSTNCVYFRAYRLAGRMARELQADPDPTWHAKADALRKAINSHFWMEEKRHYRYLVDPFGGCGVQEGFGHAFVILFGIADVEKAGAVLSVQHVTPAGIPCLWPCFDRYRRDGHYGRHSGTVWPPIQGFWAEACVRQGRADAFAFELHTLAANAVRDGQFFEIYHPDTGLPYGGLQEREGVSIDVWEPVPHMTWSATAFLRMLLLGVVGMRFRPDGIHFDPLLPPGLTEFKISGLRYRGTTIEIVLRGVGSEIERFRLNGKDATSYLKVGHRGVIDL